MVPHAPTLLLSVLAGCNAMFLTGKDTIADEGVWAVPFHPLPEPTASLSAGVSAHETTGVLLQMKVEPRVPIARTDPGIRTMTVVLAAHNEHLYLNRTVKSISDETPSSVLKEIIVVDDASEPPLSTLLGDFPEVRVVRHEERRGLIKARSAGANAAEGDMIMFLDAHVRPASEWWRPILKNVNENYKRVVVPIITILDGDTWVPNDSMAGAKMMFDWGLGFNWFEDHNDLVPVASGGLLGITKKWWHESGEYDDTMQFWGGENIEQSLRVWLCGGEIRVARDSKVGHVFRNKFPYQLNFTEVNMNLIRTVETWLDGYKENFYKKQPALRSLRERMPQDSIKDRRELKQRLQCKPFQWYVDKFHDVFKLKHMLPEFVFQIKDAKSGLCLEVDKDTEKVHARDCTRAGPSQQWRVDHGGIFGNVAAEKCLDGNAGRYERLAMYPCLPPSPAGSFAATQLWSLKDGHLRIKDKCAYVETSVSDSLILLKDCTGLPERGVLEVFNNETNPLR